MAANTNAILVAGVVGIGAFFLLRGKANGVDPNDTGVAPETAAVPGCVPCNWPTPIPPGLEECPGCLRSWVVPPPFHFLFPWFHPVPVGNVPGMTGWSIPGPGTTLAPPSGF